MGLTFRPQSLLAGNAFGYAAGGPKRSPYTGG